MANFNLPDISGEFTPQQPKPKTIEDVMHDAEVVRALSDPQGYIQDKQLGQISKGIANLKTDKIIEPLQMMANDRINQHIGDVQKLYSGNTGFNKYRLDSKQNIQKQAYERKLFGDMGTLNEFTKDYNDLQNYLVIDSTYKDPLDIPALSLKEDFLAKAPLAGLISAKFSSADKTNVTGGFSFNDINNNC